MRPLSEQQLALLTNRAGCTRRARVRLLGPGGTWWDCSALPVGNRPADFLEEVSVDTSLGEPVALARVRLVRQVGLASLAPLMADSPLNNLGSGYEPLIRSGRPVVVEVGLAPLGQEPSEWMEVFRGRVDTPRDSGDTVEFSARDYAGLLQDTMIEEEREYGSDAGVPLQSVVQDILDDNGQGAFGLYTPEDPEWDLGKYVQRKEAVLTACESLAVLAGAGVRYGWSPVAGAMALTLYLPDREATAPAWAYGPGDYTALPDVELPVEDVRTAVTVWYWDSADKDAAGQPKLKRVDRQADAPTLAALGRRWAEIALASTDNLDTLPEVQRFADYFISDMAQTPLGVALEVALHPGLELGDLIYLSPNGVQYSAGQTAAVVQLTHSYSREGARTRLTLRGKPSLSPRVWLSREAGRPGLPRTAPYTGPSAPSILSVASLPSGLAVSVAPATSGPDTAEYELHVSTASGFTPDTANPSTTLKETAARTRFELGGLKAGQAYYGRVVARDALGNRGPASAQFVLTTSYTPPAGLLPRVSYGALPLNGDFEAQSDAAAPPDGCTLLAGAWGVDAFLESSTVFSGAKGLRLVKGSAGETRVALQAFVARPGERLAVKAIARPGTLGAQGSVYVRWLDASLSSLSVSPAQTSASLSGSAWAVGTWAPLGGYLTVPANARYAQVELATGSSGASLSTYFDSVTVDPALTVVPRWETLAHPSLGGSLTAYEPGWAPDTARPLAWRVNALGDVELRGSVGGGASGSVAFYLTGVGTVVPSGATSSSSPARFRVPAGSGGEATVSVYASGGSAAFVITGTTTQVALDGVRYSTA